MLVQKTGGFLGSNLLGQPRFTLSVSFSSPAHIMGCTFLDPGAEGNFVDSKIWAQVGLTSEPLGA